MPRSRHDYEHALALHAALGSPDADEVRHHLDALGRTVRVTSSQAAEDHPAVTKIGAMMPRDQSVRGRSGFRWRRSFPVARAPGVAAQEGGVEKHSLFDAGRPVALVVVLADLLLIPGPLTALSLSVKIIWGCS
jgi:hypothetical protein